MKKQQKWLGGLAKQLFGLLVVLASGCIPVMRTPQPLLLYVIEPVAGASVRVGDSVRVRGFWSGEEVKAVLLRVNGKVQTAAQLEAPLLTVEWTPTQAGTQVLFLEALDASGRVIARSDVLVLQAVAVPSASPPTPTLSAPAEASPQSTAQVMIGMPTETPAPAPTDIPMASPTPTGAVSTSEVVLISLITPSPSPTPMPTSAAALLKATPALDERVPQLVVTYTFANLRAGPGTFYPKLGQLNQGDVATVTGRTADSQWWRILHGGTEAWVFGALVAPNQAAASVAVVKPAAVPTPPPLPSVSEMPHASPAPATPTPEMSPTPTPTPRWVCTPESPQWAARLNPTSPQWTFCVAHPLEFMPSGHPDEMALIWHVYGDIRQVELLVESAELGCGVGPTSEQKRWIVPNAMAGFVLNRATFAPGGYKISLAITLQDGRTERFGALNFCGTR
ncbi:MAG: SH3 domain-containing protein [Thermoflexales bacterium]|nr:SH3 domain-containing protein [Thermoflexales bacterium]MCX7939274.1 SH3 domain-containing protein [Thermoflexales bacterium]MDW8293035.1 SH3 domain-containing protein [Anaerolineae bacterium]